jgi:hypothetical protein
LHSVIDWNGVSQTFSLDWPWSVIPLISISQVGRIIGLSHCTWPLDYI